MKCSNKTKEYVKGQLWRIERSSPLTKELHGLDVKAKSAFANEANRIIASKLGQMIPD